MVCAIKGRGDLRVLVVEDEKHAFPAALGRPRLDRATPWTRAADGIRPISSARPSATTPSCSTSGFQVDGLTVLRRWREAGLAWRRS